MDSLQERAIAKIGIALDGGSVADVMSIVNGPIWVMAMILEITEAVSNNSCTMAWNLDPAAGAGSAVPIGTAVDIANLPIGDFVCSKLDGSILMLCDLAGDIKLPRGMAATQTGGGIILPIGGIDFTMSNSDPTSGIGILFIRYKPLFPKAHITY